MAREFVGKGGLVRSPDERHHEEPSMNIDPDRIYLPTEVADILRCGLTNVYRLMSAGAIATITIGAGKRGKRITGRALRAFLEDRSEGGPVPRRTFKYLKID
jgi:hypothetical protein